MPSAYQQLVKLIGIKPSFQRFMIHNQGAIVSAGPDTAIKERPMFQIVKDLPVVVAKYSEQCLLTLLERYVLPDQEITSEIGMNFFRKVHGGGPSILKGVEESPGLAIR
ncbi:hypothetical protein PTKIN_Ptkin01aG0012500 [Pterospermum kingtungense]